MMLVQKPPSTIEWEKFMNFHYEEDSEQLLSKLECFIPSAGTDSVIRETVSDILSRFILSRGFGGSEKNLVI